MIKLMQFIIFSAVFTGMLIVYMDKNSAPEPFYQLCEVNADCLTTELPYCDTVNLVCAVQAN